MVRSPGRSRNPERAPGAGVASLYHLVMESLLLLDRAVLAALASDGPATGRGVNRKLGGAAPVYPVLRRLERERLVASLPVAGSTRRARLYRVTRGGQETLAALRLWAANPSWANRHKAGPDAG